MTDPTVVRARFPARRGQVRATTWWGKAWVRAVEESAYDEKDATQGRTLARRGRVGAIGAGPGRATAVVEDTTGVFTTSVGLPVLGVRDWELFLDELAGRSGHAAALLAGELPHSLMEDAEAAGVELLPYGSELEPTCPCDSWVQPCRHALALTYQLGWWVDEDPFLLFLLRGRTREQVLAGLDERYDAQAGVFEEPEEPAFHTGPLVAEAAERARMVLALAEHAPTGDGLADPAVAAYDVAVEGLVRPGRRGPAGPS
ncbi:MAG: hypothetical protein Q8Q02_12275 [Nocardioides sp.]|nr:hypothetical protein [Nocardioides sp.]